MSSLILFLTLTLNLKLIMIRCGQVKSLLNMLCLVNLLKLVTHLLKLEGLLDLLKAFHQPDMGQLLPIR